MKILFFIFLATIRCGQFEQLLQQALTKTLDEDKDCDKQPHENLIQNQIQGQDILQQLLGNVDNQEQKTHEIIIDDHNEPHLQDDNIIKKEKDQIAQLVEDIEKNQHKQHPFHDDNFENIAQQFAQALHQQTERMKNAQLLDEHDEENYHRREVHPEVIVISERPDNIDHFDPKWEKNNSYQNIQRVPKVNKPEIEIIEIPDGYIKEPNHYHPEILQSHDYPQTSTGQVFPKLGMKGNKKFKSELKEIFQELGDFLQQEQPQIQSNEEQKTNLNHIQASEDDTHYKFAKVTAKEHKIPKDQFDLQKAIEVIEQLEDKKMKI